MNSFSNKLSFCEEFFFIRFLQEITEGLRPADRCITSANCDEGGKPLRSIPEDCYDTGDGYYDPTQRVIYRYDEDVAKGETGKMLRQALLKFTKILISFTQKHVFINVNASAGKLTQKFISQPVGKF